MGRTSSAILLAILIAISLGCKTCAEQHEDCSSVECNTGLTCLEYVGPDDFPAESCEIPCSEDADCPTTQTCEDVTPGPGMVCAECIWNGMPTGDPDMCCDGLTPTSGCSPGENCDGKYYCTQCGDGLCDSHETPWECPQDCRDCSGVGLDAAACSRELVLSWEDSHRREIAAELSSMTFESRAEKIADYSWYGEVPGVAFSKHHDDGPVRALIGLKISPEMMDLSEAAQSQDVLQIAEAVVERFGGLLFGTGHGELLVPKLRFDPGTDRNAVIYQQWFEEVPVVGGALSLVFDQDLNLVRVANGVLPGISHGTVPDVSMEEALESIAIFTGNSPTVVVAERTELFIYGGEEIRTDTRLVYEIAAENTRTQAQLGAFQVDAFTGEVLEKHLLDWRWPMSGKPPSPLPLPAGAHHTSLHLIDQSYEDAYDCGGNVCSILEAASAGISFESIAMAGLNAGNTLVWQAGDDWAVDSDWREPTAATSDLDPWEIEALRPIAYMIDEMLYPYFLSEFPSDLDVLGTSGAPLRIYSKTKMGGETVGFKSNSTFDLYLVEGALELGTFAHEFGHYTSGSIHQALPDTVAGDTLEEARADTFNMIWSALYRYQYPSDPERPEEICVDEEGSPMEIDPSVSHNCFNVYDPNLDGPGNGGYKHETIEVHRIGINTRCGAVEHISPSADAPENIWRSFAHPEAQNHGHGRGAATFDQFISSGANDFQYGIWSQSDDANITLLADPEMNYQYNYCGTNEPNPADICTCGDHYGTSHTNNGIHNKFFFNLSGYSGAMHKLAGANIHDSAIEQRTLLQSIYGPASVSGYDDWAQTVSDLGDTGLTAFSDLQRDKVKAALRDTRIFLDAGQSALTPSDSEAVTFWGEVDDQRLYVFGRVAQDHPASAFSGTDRPRELYYAVYDMSSAGDWEFTASCPMPDFNIPGEIPGEEITVSPISGFAPTAVNLGDRIWVAWSQYDATHPEQEFGHLAYSSLDPFGAPGDVCGSWAQDDLEETIVVYDAETEIYGSVRSTRVDRGYVIHDPGFYFEDGPAHEDWTVVVDPAGPVTLAAIENLGFTLDAVQNQTMRDQDLQNPVPMSVSAPVDDFDTALQGIAALRITDGAGVSRMPTAKDPRAPVGANLSPELNWRSLNAAIVKAASVDPDIVLDIATVLPNTLIFIEQQRGSVSPIAVDLRVWEPVLPGPPPGPGGSDPEIPGPGGPDVFLPMLNISTVAVSFLGEETGSDENRQVVVRQYGIEEDPWQSVDRVIGSAHYTAGLATVGETETEGNRIRSISRDNVVACTDFVETQESGDKNMSCRVFVSGQIIGQPPVRRIKPAGELSNVGVRVQLTAAPRAVSLGDRAYIMYRGGSESASAPMYYVAFEGPDLDPVTYNPLLYGLDFPASFDGPSKLVLQQQTNVMLPAQPSVSASSRWPLFAGSFFVTEYQGLGYVGVDYGTQTEIYARGPETPVLW